MSAPSLPTYGALILLAMLRYRRLHLATELISRQTTLVSSRGGSSGGRGWDRGWGWGVEGGLYLNEFALHCHTGDIRPYRNWAPCRWWLGGSRVRFGSALGGAMALRLRATEGVSEVVRGQ